MQVNRPNTTGPAYDNKQGNSPAAPPAKPQPPRIYTPVPPPPPPSPPPAAKTPAPSPQSAQGPNEVTTDPKTGVTTEQQPGTTTAPAPQPPPLQRAARSAPTGTSSPEASLGKGANTGPGAVLNAPAAPSTSPSSTPLQGSVPDVGQEAESYAKDFFKEKLGLNSDPRTTYFNEFSTTPRSQYTAGGRLNTSGLGQWSDTHPAGSLKSSTPLSELIKNNVPDSFIDAGRVTDGDSRFGIYDSNDANREYKPADNKVPMDTFREKWKSMDFSGHFLNKLNGYMQANEKPIAKAAMNTARQEADRLQESGQLSPEDHEIAQAGFHDPTVSTGAPPQRKVSTHMVDVDGTQSTNMLRVEDAKSGRNVLYMPGESESVKGFSSKKAVDDWLREQPKDQAEAFAGRHFSQNKATGRDGGPHVGELLNRTDRTPGGRYRPPVFMGPGTDVSDAPFKHLAEATRKGFEEDARFEITSNEDVSTRQGFRATSNIPVVGGIHKMISGKTPAERGEGLKQLGIDAITSLIPMPGGGKVAGRGLESTMERVAAKAGEETVEDGVKTGLKNEVKNGVESGVENRVGDGAKVNDPKPGLPVGTGDSYEAFRSSYGTGGRTPDSQGIYHIDSKPHVPLGKTSPDKSQPLFQIRKNESGQYEMVKPGEISSFHAPLVRQKEDGSFEAVREGLQGGGGALGKTKDPHARFFADKEKRAKKTTEGLARQSFDEVRSAYEGGKKSNNKTYTHISSKGGPSRDDMQDEADTLLGQIRDKNRANHQKPIDQKTVFPVDNPLRIDAGNCGELSGALARTVTEKGGYAETWTFANKKHMFTVIGDPKIPHLQANDFSKWKGVWIGDPWANIFVEAPKYPQAFKEKMQKWASEGKLIQEGNQVISPTDPKWVNAVDGVKLQHEAPEVGNLNPWQFQTYTA